MSDFKTNGDTEHCTFTQLSRGAPTIIVVSKEAKDKAMGQAETWHEMGTSLYVRQASMKAPE